MKRKLILQIFFHISLSSQGALVGVFLYICNFGEFYEKVRSKPDDVSHGHLRDPRTRYVYIFQLLSDMWEKGDFVM